MQREKWFFLIWRVKLIKNPPLHLLVKEGIYQGTNLPLNKGRLGGILKDRDSDV